MPEYLAPGVYVEEISTGPKPIEGVSTSVAGFVGPTERGPEDIQYVTSWLAYQRWYGGHLGVDKSFMSYAVQGFFDNGGQRCFVGRVMKTDGANRAFKPLDDKLTLSAVGRGDWGNRIYVRVRQASKARSGVVNAKSWFRVTLYYYSPFAPNALPDGATPLNPESRENARKPGFVRPDVTEDYDNLTLDPMAANSAVTTINLASRLVRVEPGTSLDGPPTVDPAADDAEAAQLDPLGGGAGSAAGITLDDYNGTFDEFPNSKPELYGQGSGFAGMSSVDEVSLLLAPDHVHPQVGFQAELLEAVVKQCEALKDRFAVLSTLQAFRPDKGKPDQDTTYGAQYYPWVRVYDPRTRDDVMLPPAGHVAGIIARTDIEQGVHKAPANAIVVGAKGLQKPVPKGDQDLLNPVGINCIRDFRPDGRGIRVWGARTMSSDPEWKYVNVRRLFLFVEESIDQGTQWVVFEPNAPETWARVVRAVSGFLNTLWRNGALFGTTPAEAYFVKCDRTTMTQDDIDAGRLICYIGIAPVKPAEFVIFRIGQKTADAQA
jgi:phage tail sheath protein FI